MATQVVELTGDEAALLRSYDRAVKKQAELEAKMRAGGDAGAAAGVQVEDALAKVNAASDQALRGLLADLGKVGPQGAAGADALKGHFTEAGKAGFRSVGEIIGKIREIDPAAADAAEAATIAFTESANSTQAQLQKVLAKMRAVGPEGRAAAEAIEAKFVQTGRIASESVADIANSFDVIDPEAAKAARAVLDNMEEAAEGSAESWSKATEDMVLKLGTVGTAAAALKTTVSLIADEIEHQKSMIENARQAHLTLAEAEQEAVKNMAGFTKEQQDTILQGDVPAVQKATIFPSRSALVVASGALASADASPEQIRPMLEAVAPLTRLKPTEADEYAMGAFNISKITGFDAKASLNLLLTGGGKALVKDPRDVAETMPTAMLTTIQNSDSENKQLVARQGAAIYALSTDMGGDVSGASSLNNTANLTAYLDKLFEVGNKELNSSIESASKAVDRQSEKVGDLKASMRARTRLQRPRPILRSSSLNSQT